jgi:hypothetical protein
MSNDFGLMDEVRSPTQPLMASTGAFYLRQDSTNGVSRERVTKSRTFRTVVFSVFFCSSTLQALNSRTRPIRETYVYISKASSDTKRLGS